MEQYVVAFSKYFIAIFLAMYTYECFSVFRFRDEARRKGIYTRQVILMFFVHFTCFLTICIQTGELQYLFFYALQQLAIFTLLVLFELFYPAINRLIIHNMCMLMTLGLVILTRLDMKKAVRQFIIILVSMVIAMLIPYFIHQLKGLKDLSLLYAAIGIVALGIVLLLGNTTYGSKLSWSFFGLSFQPSEFIKIVFVFFVASALYRSTGIVQVAYVTLIAGIHVVILVASRDLGGALIFYVTFLLMVYLATKNFWYLLLGIAGGSGASFLAFKLFRHVQERVQAWRDPWSVIDGDGYQITQSLFSLGRGDLFGLGLFQGAPQDIPKVEQDFIFSAVAEEMGLIVAFCIILIALSCFIMFMNISMQLRNRFYQLVAFGMAVLYIFQVFLTIGGDTKFIPLTGVTLPLVSYGGSSIMTTLMMFSVIEGLYILRQDEEAARAEKKKGKSKKKQGGRYAGKDDGEVADRREAYGERQDRVEDDGEQAGGRAEIYEGQTDRAEHYEEYAEAAESGKEYAETTGIYEGIGEEGQGKEELPEE